MKPRFRFVPPSRADGTVLPAILAGMLGLMALVQMAMTDAVTLPPSGPIGAGAVMRRVDDPESRGLPAAVLSRAIFAPAIPTTSEAAGGVTDPLGGATIVGTIGVGRARYAIVQTGGVSRRVAVGGTISGWRLVGLGEDTARLMRGGERLTRAFGAGAAAPAERSDAPVEDQ